MTVIASKLVDWNLLGQAVAASVVVGLAVLVIAGLTVVSSLRSQDERAGGNDSAAVGFNALAVVGVLAIIGAIAAGIWAMTQ